ncbi:MAG: hypothetical protein EOO06_00790 [Chitinophagaceae bacterium]|nr:MAG: hypothetical protein EOO06_00790 [Chitinophagaceae bacterium]
MTEAKKKEIKVSYISYEEYTDYSYIDVATWFIVNALQQYVYFHTSDRAEAQRVCNEIYGAGFYTVKTSKIQKTKSSREDGGYSAYGNNSRKGFAANLRKTV